MKYASNARVFFTVFCAVCWAANMDCVLADSVAYVNGMTVPRLSITPLSPTSTDVVSFTAPMDGKVHGNECEMRVALGGSPLIVRDDAERVITISRDGIFSPICSRIYIPHAGAAGEFGPLDAGAWLFRDGFGNELSFAVSGDVVLEGDFDGSGTYTAADINALVTAISSDPSDVTFDLNGDGLIDTEDRDWWLSIAGAELNSSAAPFFAGDVNLDGAVDSADLGKLLNSFGRNAGVTWDGGELNGDGAVDSSDLGVLLNDFGRFSAASAVPEPSGAIAAIMGLLVLVGIRRPPPLLT